MAIRMQQRRGTAAQWTSADPILGPGEIGVETDTNQFKLGDGTSVWSDLSYFKNLEDLGGSLDDYILLTQKGAASGVATLDSNGQIPISQLASLINDAPSALDTLGELADLANVINSAMETHSNLDEDVHGIANTAELITQTQLDTTLSTATTGLHTYTNDAVHTHEIDTLSVHGIDNTANLAYQADITRIEGLISDAEDLASSDLSNHNGDTTNVHGITDTSALETKTGAQTKADSAQTASSTALSAHNTATTSIHGISNTANLVYTNDSRLTDARTPSDLSVTAGKIATDAVTTVKILDGNVTTAKHADASITTAKIADSAITSAKIADATIVDADISSSAAIAQSKISGLSTSLGLKADLASPTFTGTVTIPTGASISGFAPLASPALTGTPTAPTATAGTNTTQVATTAFVGTAVSNLVASAPATLDTLNELATALGNDAAFSTTVTTSIGTKAPLASPTFTGTVTIPTGANISGFAKLATPSFTGGVTVDGSGIIFTDGTQTKAGVPSITTIATALAAGAQTIAAGQQDKFIPLTGAVVITLPATGYSTGQSIDFYQESGTGAYFNTTNSVVGTPGLKFRATSSVCTAMKTASGWLVFGDLSA